MLNRRQVIVGAITLGVAALAMPDERVEAAAPQPATPLNFKPPAGTTDTHRHIFGDLQRYPYSPKSSYRHEPATVDDMRKLDRALHIDRRVLIQPSAYDTDNSCLLDGLKAFGTAARGVVAIDDNVSDSTLDQMHTLGVRGVRMNFPKTEAEAKRQVSDVASRIKGRNWHINTATDLASIEQFQDILSNPPVPIVIDHYAGAQLHGGTAQRGFDVLVRLLNSGSIYVKMSRLHNLSKQAPGYADVEPIAKAILATNHERILWGTDWPHAGLRPPGFSPTDISPYLNYDDGLVFNEFASWVGDPATLRTILVDNPAKLYGFR